MNAAHDPHALQNVLREISRHAERCTALATGSRREFERFEGRMDRTAKKWEAVISSSLHP